jgi:hypothetical protein
MLFNYIFEYKLISFQNFKIVLPATFVNKSYIVLSETFHTADQNMFMHMKNNTVYANENKLGCIVLKSFSTHLMTFK